MDKLEHKREESGLKAKENHPGIEWSAPESISFLPSPVLSRRTLLRWEPGYALPPVHIHSPARPPAPMRPDMSAPILPRLSIPVSSVMSSSSAQGHYRRLSTDSYDNYYSDEGLTLPRFEPGRALAPVHIHSPAPPPAPMRPVMSTPISPRLSTPVSSVMGNSSHVRVPLSTQQPFGSPPGRIVDSRPHTPP